MSLSRRRFFGNLGVGSVGLLSAPFIIGRGREAMAFEAATVQPPDDGGFIRISSNENARGPGKKTIDALRNAISPRVGRGYPPDYTGDLAATIADIYGVGRDHVIVGTGSGPILEAATRAFCSAQKPLVTAAPTYGTCDQAARRIGAPVKMITVDKSLGLDTDAMAEAAKGAGMIFFCNPNNPTGTVHNAAAVEKFVRRVKQSSPETRILIDEAYIDYTHDAAVKTAVPLAKELSGVLVSRSFSKAHGMAGLRLGYAIGQPETMKTIASAWNLGSVNTLTAAAGIASLRDPKHIEEERAENARVRDFTREAFKSMGYEAADCHTNCIFVDLKRPAKDFRDACAALKVSVGRDFPPFEKTHSRITLGTMDEMRQAVQVFRKVLTASSTSAGVR
ncbi:MAG TPA: aminotransferase class I/II-fold pyridoxal phosphate-dependent enzyme [Vicinamibacterales bacterium]|jgi:histidinol-phosphate aminotransferase|nr:aminotransferase class I/II-fold pyridoxal phosphate-dependent enzyme [Vicinamibacterales bacterium]